MMVVVNEDEPNISIRHRCVFHFYCEAPKTKTNNHCQFPTSPNMFVIQFDRANMVQTMSQNE